MKRYIKSVFWLLSCAALLVACNDDNDSNPVLKTPASFTLHTPAYATESLDLSTSTSIPLSWEYPALGFPMAVQYTLEVSATNQFTKAFNPSLGADEQTPDYAATDSVYSGLNGYVKGAELAKALQRVARYTQGSVPALQDTYLRLCAVIGPDTVYSNVITLKTIPYYIELKDADPNVWYLVGNCIGDGKWGNSADNIGKSLIPMYTVLGNSYDKKTGDGEFEYVGYFPATAAFKIIEKVGSWDYGMCGGGVGTPPVYRNAEPTDPGDIKITEAGYYKITLNTATHVCKIEKSDVTAPAAYTAMNMPGDYNSWAASSPMTAMTTVAGLTNHDWMTTVTIPARGGAKFTDGTTSWGANKFPYGFATATGGNIPVKAGTYRVFYNDITGSYTFLEQK